MSGSKVDPEADKMNLLLTELVTMKEQQATMFEQQTLLLAQITTMNNQLESHGQRLAALEKTTHEQPSTSAIHADVVGSGATKDLTVPGVEGKLSVHDVMGGDARSGGPDLNGGGTSAGSGSPGLNGGVTRRIWRPRPLRLQHIWGMRRWGRRTRQRLRHAWWTRRARH
jgi:hypothetical protein